MRNLVIGIFLILCSQSFGKEKPVLEVRINKPGYQKASVQNNSIKKIDYEKIQKKIKEIKKNLCQKSSDINFKVWFEFTTEGSVIVASGSATAGIEISFNCK